MKKKILLFITVLALSLCLFSCNNDNLTDFQKLVKSIYDSESVLAGYKEKNTIKDGEFEIYSKETNFKLERSEKVKSEVEIVEKKLSTSGTTLYDETVTAYKTVDEVKYTTINGVQYENEYVMPTYYLTFVLSEEFMESDYSLSVSNSNYILTGKVADDKVSSLFLNKSLGNITDLEIEIIIQNSKLQSFNAKYTSDSGFDVEISTTYLYAEKGQGVAVFYLEGGICQNSKNRVSYVYSFDGTKIDTLIVDPNVLETNEQDKILKNGYHIEGWYQTKVENPDGTIEYSDKWDFSNDRMSINGVTLYAKWKENRVYTYELYYFDENNNEVLLDSYEVSEGEKFNDILLDKKEVKGYTSLGYLDENGKEWNKNFTHPGGDTDKAVKIYLNLIEGEYTIVKTAKQFKTALSKNKNIYLMNDIDFDGGLLCIDSYSGLIMGNGHTVSNFEIDYDSSKSGLKYELDENGALDKTGSQANQLYISLFFELRDATIKDITFDNIIIDVNTSYSAIKNIVVAPLAITAFNTKIENVNFGGNITISKKPDCDITVVTDKFFYYSSSDVIIEGNSSVLVK